MKNIPLVSVYIPTFNRLFLLKRAVKSVLQQTYDNFELLIVDDGSSDGTVDYLNELSYSHDNVRVFFDKLGKRGACSSRNLAIANARGEFVTGLDDDDYFHPKRIEKLVDKYDPSMAFIASNYIVVDGQKSARSSFLSRNIDLNLLIIRNAASSQALVERGRMLEVGGFDENLAASQDLDVWIRLVQRYGSGFRVRDSLYYVDVSHDEKRISTSQGRVDGTVQFLKKHNEIISGKTAIYINECYVEKHKKPRRLIGFLTRYGVGLTAEIVRNHLKLG